MTWARALGTIDPVTANSSGVPHLSAYTTHYSYIWWLAPFYLCVSITLPSASYQVFETVATVPDGLYSKVW